MKVFKKSAVSTAVSSFLLASGVASMLALPAHAQQAAEEPAAQGSNALNLEQVVVTGTTGTKSKLRSSASVTDVDGDKIKDFGAHTEAEVLLLIPGIRTDATAGPGGNANISVRGLPISSGGSKYVQLQEDGLPTVQFGDMNFSNNDYWTRFDNNVDRIETLRGGSSSVFASHAPGAVINYISKTGKDEGGSIALSHGLNFDENRFDGDVGGHLAPDIYYHIGGYYREGQGTRHTTDNSLQGLQLKGNITKEFNGGKGYFRVNFKYLDEHAPTTPQTFLNATLSGGKLGGFSKTSFYDGTRDSQYSIYNSRVPGIDPVTHAVQDTSLVDGITSKSKSVGFEFHNALANGYTIDDKFRISSNAGAFNAQFWNLQTLDSYLSGFHNANATTGAAAVYLNGALPVSAKYYNGPGAGTAVSGSTLISNGAAINVQTPDMGNLVNDLSVNKQFQLADATALDLRGGWFHSRQNVVQRWAISERLVEAAPNGRVIDAFDASGVALTTAGLTGYNNQWGVARDIDVAFTTDAPYLNLDLSAGDLNLEGGIRHETFGAHGTYSGSKQVAGGYDVNGDGKITGAENSVFFADTANPGLVDYKISYNNYTLGANYRLTKDLSGFARYSQGNRAIADRLLFSSNIDAVTGQLTEGGKSAALAPVKQTELGAKYRGRLDAIRYGVSATYFHSTTTEFDYDQTRQDDPNKPNYAGPKLNVVGYKADGIELETSATSGNFGIDANLTYSNETKTSDQGNPSSVGKTSSGVPKIRYTISPRYAFGDAVIGATVRGQSSVYADAGNTVQIDGHYIVNAFVNYDFGKGLIGSLNVSNLLDKVYPAGDAGFVGGSTTIVGAGVETGRTINATLRYQF